MSMREKIAERLMQHYAEGGPWDGFMEADIVLDALMEPTEGMKAASISIEEVEAIDWVSSLFGTGISSAQDIVCASYAAMIRAAKEGE